MTPILTLNSINLFLNLNDPKSDRGFEKVNKKRNMRAPETRKI